jgi:hypothetical protein
VGQDDYNIVKGRVAMNTMSKPLVALALGISIVALASPSLAQTRRDPNHMSAARAAALLECSRRADREYPTWISGNLNVQVYDACMGDHGQSD